MEFSLNTKIIKPENNNIKNAVILLHGYGGDGNDISAVTLNWKRFLPETIFLCPDGHEACPINPNGFQWFDLEKDNSSYILEQTIKAEKKLNLFINEIKSEFNLNNSKICLSGFSQGCMISINLGLTMEEEFNCVDLELTLEDLDALEESLDDESLPETAGFFFGNNADDHYVEQDREFIREARAAIKQGYTVVYSSWW